MNLPKEQLVPILGKLKPRLLHRVILHQQRNPHNTHYHKHKTSPH